MKQIEQDDFKLCRICRKDLNEEELEVIKTSHMPALCREHMEYAKKQFEKCAPLLSKMKF
jgi:RNA polymerase-binding transcription factor DksA